MIVTETQGNLIHTYSDAGFMIRGGDPVADYVDAWDPIDSGRTYTETDIPIPDEEAGIEDYQAAIGELGLTT